uniref:Uncharacterized protein n=1 Tax=Arundo donax TaxID=35708 RepID=A0A0A9FT84_ARUDO
MFDKVPPKKHRWKRLLIEDIHLLKERASKIFLPFLLEWLLRNNHV